MKDNVQKLLFLISEGIFSSINVADNIAMGYSHFCTEGSISNYPPDKNNFKGNVYVLISGGTVSAATYFAALVKNNKHGMPVGTETGSGEASTTAAWFNTYILPKTKSKLTVPMSEVYFMKAKQDKGRGCLPDKELTFDAFQQYIRTGKDPEIQYTLDIIRAGKQ